MAKPNPRVLEVIGTTYITPHMCRVTLGGDGLRDFPVDQESAYIKLMFPQEKESRPLMRTYTIRGQRDNEIDVDFFITSFLNFNLVWNIGIGFGLASMESSIYYHILTSIIGLVNIALIIFLIKSKGVKKVGRTCPKTFMFADTFGDYSQ